MAHCGLSQPQIQVDLGGRYRPSKQTKIARDASLEYVIFVQDVADPLSTYFLLRHRHSTTRRTTNTLGVATGS